MKRRSPARPMAPWRFIALAVVIGVAIPCGIAAAAPTWNGADLAVLLCLAAFVAVFTTPGED